MTPNLPVYQENSSLYIFVDTRFKRTMEPIFVLGLLEPRRHIKIDKNELLDKNIKQILPLISKRVKQHYADNDGQIVLWGKIYNYVVKVLDATFVFNPYGEYIVKNDLNDKDYPKACLSLR